MINKKLSIRIFKKNQPLGAIHTILLISLFCGFLTDVLSVPSAIKYIIDVANVLLLVLSWMNLAEKRKGLYKDSRAVLVWLIAFLIYVLTVYIFNFQSPMYFLWGIRNNFRFYAFFYGVVLFLRKQDADDYLDFFDRLFYINTMFCLIQFFVFGLRQDFLGGIFGTKKGCNSYLNIFQVIVVTKSMLFYMHKKESLKTAITKIVIALVVAAMAELKFFFVEALIIVAISAVVTKMTGRKLLISVAGVAAAFAGALLLTKIFPSYEGFLSISSLIRMASEGGYSSNAAVNRLSAIPILSNTILRDSGAQWFGLGLGNCDTSSFAFLNTPFFRRYEHMRYHWFSTAFMFLETGYIGLMFFFGFFVLVGIKSYKISKTNAELAVYGQISAIMAVMCVLIGIYNSSLRTEAAYMIYFVMAIPFALQREAVEEGRKQIGN